MDQIKEFVDHIIADGVITSDEHEKFMEMVHCDGEIDAEESKQISRIFKLLQEGKIQIVDPERDKLKRDEIDDHKADAISEDLQKEATLPMAKPQLDEEQREDLHAAIQKVRIEKEESRNKIGEFLEGKREKLEAEQKKLAADSEKSRFSNSESMLHRAKKKLDDLDS